jgi:hypothetical protein
VKQIRQRLTYANVMSSIAVFLMLGGATAFAAKKIGANELKSNAVQTGKIKKEAVTTNKIKNGAVTTSKIADGAVTTSKLADKAVTGAKIDAATLPAVPNATNATNAANAANADKLGGKLPASYESKALEAATGVVDLPENTPTTLVTLNLPAGRYLIQTRVDLNNNGANTVSVAGTCTLAAGTATASYEIPGLFGASGPGDRYAMTGEIVSTLAAPGQATLSCSPSWTSGNGVNPTITAISVQP